DGGKTSLLRLFAARNIAYATSRTILYIGKSEPHALRSVGWLRRQIETNARYAATFGLVPARPWGDSHICISHEIDRTYINVLGLGITGSVRGLNIDDYRPDLIISTTCSMRKTPQAKTGGKRSTT
ncbi:MAG: hypothetical protein HC801_12740, partial [Nitrospira sp.]|nr:hypothetical protein [Nitrospira sp.]